jgi:Ca-activated chloride channel homolog
MRIRKPVAIVFALAGAGVLFDGTGVSGQIAAPLPQQTRSANVRIVSPVDGGIAAGPTRLRAAVEPPSAASGVVFFVDGRQVCAVTVPPFECDWNAGSTITQHHVRLVANLVGGGRVVRTARTAAAAFAETVDVDVVKVTVTVTDDRGRYIKGLPRSVFRVSEDGRPQTISHFFAEDALLELVVAVDMSQSMQPAMSQVKQAVSDFLGAVPSRHAVTVLGFNDHVFTLAPRTVSPAERIKAVDALAAWGSTVLHDVILQGADLLDAQAGRKALIVFTDGDDSNSYATLAEVEQRLQTSDLTLYMIGQGQALARLPLKSAMDRLARQTGGRAFFTERIEDLHGVFRQLLDELSQQYALGYQPTNSARDDTWRQITVDVEGQKRVRARQGYRAEIRTRSGR